MEDYFEFESDSGRTVRVPESDMCPDCTTPRVQVDVRTGQVWSLIHDPSCPNRHAALYAEER